MNTFPLVAEFFILSISDDAIEQQKLGLLQYFTVIQGYISVLIILPKMLLKDNIQRHIFVYISLIYTFVFVLNIG